jgi:hypothetical protein
MLPDPQIALLQTALTPRVSVARILLNYESVRLDQGAARVFNSSLATRQFSPNRSDG